MGGKSPGSAALLDEVGQFDKLVDRDFADDRDLKPGDRLTLLSGSGRRAELQIKATYDPPPFFQLLGSVSIPKAEFDKLYDRARNQYTFINVAGDATADPGELLVLLGLVLAGHVLGTFAFRRLDHERFYKVVLVLVLLTGAASVVAGLA